MKKIALLGSTGSIGESTLAVARHLGIERIKVETLAVHKNIDGLEKQIQEFHPSVVAVFDKDKAQELQKRHPRMQILAGMEGVVAAATHPNVNFVVSAMSGTAGLVPTVEAIKAGKAVGLANKEALVSGGVLVTALARKKGVPLIPIDSEHSALFQCLNGENTQRVHRIVLTASGGALRDWSYEQLKSVSVDQALAHPNWKMGPKITIDCSTLMNKGLEIIEAHWLFDLPYHKIEVVIHPQSIIHSLVEFVDFSILAQMSNPTMIIPIQYALSYPDRFPGMLRPFDFTKYTALEFLPPDLEKFRCLRLAFDAIRAGGSLPCYMNAANEVLVDRFLQKQISWLDIGEKLEALMQAHPLETINSLEHILAIDKRARVEACNA